MKSQYSFSPSCHAIPPIYTKTFRNVSLEIAGSQLDIIDKVRSDLNVNVDIARSTGGNFRKGQTLGTVLPVPGTSFEKTEAQVVEAMVNLTSYPVP